MENNSNSARHRRASTQVWLASAGAPDPGTVYRLTYYVTSASASSERLGESIRPWFAEGHLSLSLTTVEVMNDPERAVQQRIFATPMLVREWPPSERRIIGDLSSIVELMRLLDIP